MVSLSSRIPVFSFFFRTCCVTAACYSKFINVSSIEKLNQFVNSKILKTPVLLVFMLELRILLLMLSNFLFSKNVYALNLMLTYFICLFQVLIHLLLPNSWQNIFTHTFQYHLACNARFFAFQFCSYLLYHCYSVGRRYVLHEYGHEIVQILFGTIFEENIHLGIFICYNLCNVQQMAASNIAPMQLDAAKAFTNVDQKSQLDIDSEPFPQRLSGIICTIGE